MPWTAKSAPKTVRGAKNRRQWARIANSCLKGGKSEGRCLRTASGVMKRQRSRR